MIPLILEYGSQSGCRIGDVREFIQDEEQRFSARFLDEIAEQVLPVLKGNPFERWIIEVFADDSGQGRELLAFRPLRCLVIDPSAGGGEPGEKVRLARAPSTQDDTEFGPVGPGHLLQARPFPVSVQQVRRLVHDAIPILFAANEAG